MKQIKLLEKNYDGFESYVDIERDVEEAISCAPIPGEYQGTIKVTITYEGDDILGQPE